MKLHGPIHVHDDMRANNGCEIVREELSSYIERRLAGSTKTQAAVSEMLASHLAECPDCDRRLRAVEAIVCAGSRGPTPSPFLAPRIIASLPASSPRRHPLRVLVPAAALVVALSIYLVFGLHTGSTTDPVAIRFYLEAERASSVVLVGDWNGWNPVAQPLSDADGDGIWETTIKLEKGKEYRYQFLIDGNEWIADPQTPFRIEDGFGGWNSILHL